MKNLESTIRIAVLGDSISQGIGSKKHNYCSNLKENIEASKGINCEIKNFAYTGTTIRYANQIVNQVLEYNPDIILCFYGNVDAMIRPKTTGYPNYYAFIPKRFKKNGMLDPRPFFSSSIKRRIFEHIDSFIRYNLKKILIRLQGTYCWIEINEFIAEYQRFLDTILSDKRTVFIISTVVVDEFFFPGTSENYSKFNEELEKLSIQNNVPYIDIYSKLRCYEWDDIFCSDHFHINQNGYIVLSDVFTDKIINYINL